MVDAGATLQRDGLALADGLADAWRDGSDGFFSLVERALARPDGAAVLKRAAAAVPDDEQVAFATELYAAAGRVLLPLGKPDGTQAVGRMHVFGLALQGTDKAVAELVQSDVMHELAQLARSCGLAHERSHVVLCPVPLDAAAAADISPVRLRRIARLLAPVALGQDGAAEAAARELSSLGPNRASGAADGLVMVTNVLIGGRLLTSSPP